MIEIKNIFKRYKNKNVVDDVSFSIEKGKITSFIEIKWSWKKYSTINSYKTYRR